MLARLLVAPDGDATTTAMLLLGVACVILAAIALAGWRRRKRSRAKWMGRLELLEQRAAANIERLERVATDEERLGRVVGQMRSELIGADADPRPQLKVVKG